MNKLFLTLVFLSLTVLTGCSCTTVAPGTVGIGVDTSGVQPHLYHPGFHATSIFTSIVPMSVQTETYEMAGQNNIHVLTHDQLSVDLEVTVSFHLNESAAISVYNAYTPDYANRIIHPIVRTAVRDAACAFTAIALVDERGRLQTEMESRVNTQVSDTLVARGLPADAIVVDNVLLRDIDLPQSLDDSIAAVQQQQQQTQQRLQALETARAEADRARVQAEGEAAAAVATAQGQADANRLLAASLTPQVLEARRIDLMGQLLANEHTRTLVLPASSMPMLQLPASE